MAPPRHKCMGTLLQFAKRFRVCKDEKKKNKGKNEVIYNIV